MNLRKRISDLEEKISTLGLGGECIQIIPMSYGESDQSFAKKREARLKELRQKFRKFDESRITWVQLLSFKKEGGKENER